MLWVNFVAGRRFADEGLSLNSLTQEADKEELSISNKSEPHHMHIGQNYQMKQLEDYSKF